MEAKRIGLLEGMNCSTNYEQEPYILTPEEELVIINNAIEAKKSHAVWKMKELCFSDNKIDEKIKEINWADKINRDYVLKRANSNKIYDNWQATQRENERKYYIQKKKELTDFWTAEQMFKYMGIVSEKNYGKKLIVNQFNKTLISAICFFITRDERFETELGFSFKKGLLIRGVSGIGKTYLVKCIENNELNPILILSMIDIADEIKSEGEYNVKNNGRKIIYMDDVGTEESTINHYGTKINFFKNFIEQTYLKNIDAGFNWLIISTNNSFNEIEEKYGFRVRSRMKEMFNVIDVSGKDMRK